VNERVRSVLFGLGLGVAVVLVLELARILATSVDTGETSIWWVVASYLAAGVIVAVGVTAGRGDRLVPLLAGILVLLLALPGIDPTGPLASAPLPTALETAATRAIAIAAVGAFGYGAIRGPRA
jgi:hypothetical protein